MHAPYEDPVRIGNWKRFGCRVIGHRWLPVAAEHWEYFCERCGFNAPIPLTYQEPWTLAGSVRRGWWLARHKSRVLGMRLRVWWWCRRKRKPGDDLPF